MEYLAIIPARGGSKGVVGKNLLPILGKPLIVWTIEQALLSKKLGKIIVTTDDEKIAQVSRDCGAEVPFLRPQSLSGDQATTESAMQHTIEWLKVNENYTPDAVVLLQCTSPVRSNDAIDSAITQFEKENLDSLLSVVPFWHFLWKSSPKVEALYDFENRPRRQDIDPKDIRFKENGSIYVSSTQGVLTENNRLHGKVGLFEMEENEGFEIDTMTDFKIIESILKQHKT